MQRERQSPSLRELVGRMRLVRFGLVGATAVSGSAGTDGTLPLGEADSLTSAEAVSTAGSAAFFRPRAGFGATSASPGDA